MNETDRAGDASTSAQEDHDCIDWNSGGWCYLCRRPLSIEEQQSPEEEVKKPKTMRERARTLAQECVLFGKMRGSQWDGLTELFVAFAENEIRLLGADGAVEATTASAEHPGNQAIAERIAEELFVNGAGQEAHRLVLTSRDGRDLGGWGKGPLTDRIVGVLAGVPGGVQTGK